MLSGVQQVLFDLPQRAKLVFPGARGGYLNYSMFQKTWRAVIRGLGLSDVRFHSLRHGFGSLMLAWGESLIYVSQQLGHSSTTLTHTTYLHLLKEGRRLDKEVMLAKLIDAMAYTGLTRGAEAEV